jgi:aspartate kinase
VKKVVKFGGSSLASAEQFKKVGNIIRSDKDRKFVVPSAPGKRYDGDIKVTDMLYDCYETAEAGKDFTKKLDAIKARYNEIIEGLGIDFSLEEDFKIVAENFAAKAGKDYAASRGEYLNGKIMAAYLGYEFIDSATVIRFDEDGNFDADITNKMMSERLASCEHAVIPGFYGAYADGKVKTFSRGGSDITGSIVARALKADLYENWTDVSGFLVTDPRIIKNPEVVDMITYRELRELSYMGASVLHEDAIFPVRKAGIPINIRNTNHPEDKGTMIVATTSQKSKYTITGIAGKKGFVAVTVDKDMMNSEIGFCRKVLQVFEENDISIEHMPSGIDTMCIFVHQDEFQEHEQVVLSGIQRAVEPDTVDVEADLALIAVVGRGMKEARGTAGRIFSALAHANINCKMIDQGSSELNIIIGVRNADFEAAIQAIYDIFIVTQL